MSSVEKQSKPALIEINLQSKLIAVPRKRKHGEDSLDDRRIRDIAAQTNNHISEGGAIPCLNDEGENIGSVISMSEHGTLTIVLDKI